MKILKKWKQDEAAGRILTDLLFPQVSGLRQAGEALWKGYLRRLQKRTRPDP